MITMPQWNAFTPQRRAELFGQRTFIPENSHGIKTGYYSDGDIVRLLRKHKREPRTVQFIADMME